LNDMVPYVSQPLAEHVLKEFNIDLKDILTEADNDKLISCA